MEIIAVPVGAGTTLSLLHSMLISVTISEKLLIQKSHPEYHKTLIIPINRLGTTGGSLDVHHSKGLDVGWENAAQSSVSDDILVCLVLMG